MNKSNLIKKILQLDGSCSAAYLATFDLVDLEYHLSILQQAHTPQAEQESQKELSPTPAMV